MQAFNNTRHDFEIQLENASVVQLCEDEPQDAIPRAVYHVGPLLHIVSLICVVDGALFNITGVACLLLWLVLEHTNLQPVETHFSLWLPLFLLNCPFVT